MTDARQLSKRNWSVEENVEGIKLGTVLRMADSLELIAKNYAQLVADRDLYKKWYGQEKEACALRDRKISALRGQITKLNQKLKAKDLSGGEQDESRD